MCRLYIALAIIACCSSAIAQTRIEVRDVPALDLSGAQAPGDLRAEAITSGFAWLRSIQREDGSWGFDDEDRFANAGSERSHVKATALVLLTFASAGQTHQDGKDRQPLDKALKYLLAHQKGDQQREQDDLIEHALSSMAICELYCLSNDKALKEPAQHAISCLQKLQNKDGGWGSKPGAASDLAVTAWCLMSLKSGHMSYLSVDPEAVKRTSAFLASVRVKDRPQFGFKSPDAEPLATAMGLLLSLYLGQKELRNPGVEELVRSTSALADAEFRYFATLTIKDSYAKEAVAWRTDMQDHLVKSQSRDGRERGSWFSAKDRSAATGGRLYQTTLNLLALLVRQNKTLIERVAPEDDFPL
jgi:hypothetical protein